MNWAGSAGVGVAGGFEAAVERTGAGGWAGVEEEVAGVDGGGAAEDAGAAFGFETMHTM
jgi:hypothetical protein